MNKPHCPCCTQPYEPQDPSGVVVVYLLAATAVVLAAWVFVF